MNLNYDIIFFYVPLVNYYLTGAYVFRTCSHDIFYFFVNNQTKRARSMTFADISMYFHLPLAEASRNLQISSTALKNVCRRYNLNRWPYRKVSAQKKAYHFLSRST